MVWGPHAGIFPLMEPNTLWLLLTRGHIEQRESSKQESIIQRTKCQQIGNRTIRIFTSQLFETNTNALSSVCNGTSRFDHMLSPRIVAEETHLLGLELRNHTFLDWSIWNISVACCSLPTFLSGCQERHCAMNHCLLAGNESACLSCIFAVRCASVTAGSAVPGSKQSLAPVHIVMRGLLHSSPVGSSMLAALLKYKAVSSWFASKAKQHHSGWSCWQSRIVGGLSRYPGGARYRGCCLIHRVKMKPGGNSWVCTSGAAAAAGSGCTGGAGAAAGGGCTGPLLPAAWSRSWACWIPRSNLPTSSCS